MSAVAARAEFAWPCFYHYPPYFTCVHAVGHWGPEAAFLAPRRRRPVTTHSCAVCAARTHAPPPPPKKQTNKQTNKTAFSPSRRRARSRARCGAPSSTRTAGITGCVRAADVGPAPPWREATRRRRNTPCRRPHRPPHPTPPHPDHKHPPLQPCSPPPPQVFILTAGDDIPLFHNAAINRESSLRGRAYVSLAQGKKKCARGRRERAPRRGASALFVSQRASARPLNAPADAPHTHKNTQAHRPPRPGRRAGHPRRPRRVGRRVLARAGAPPLPGPLAQGAPSFFFFLSLSPRRPAVPPT